MRADGLINSSDELDGWIEITYNQSTHEYTFLLNYFYLTGYSDLSKLFSIKTFFQVMEGDKEAYLEEASKALRRQRKTITDSEAEKHQLSRSINVSR